jgi:hypothetical protein
MTHSNLTVEVQDVYILVALRGTCFRAKYRKQEATWLATDEWGAGRARSNNHLVRVPKPRLGGGE